MTRWHGHVPTHDDFDRLITDEFIDGVEKASMKWCYMTPASFKEYGVGLGTGKGQRYKKVNGDWVKVEG